MANRRTSGRSRRKASSRLPARSGASSDRPVTLPPGRARLAARPLPTGSFANARTIGIVDVACFAATPAPPEVTMTSTLSRANSAAISPKRSLRPSAQRYSIATVLPSTQPSSRSRCTNAGTQSFQTEGVVVPRNPMVGSFAGCCACARPAAVATNRPAMNIRRLMCPPSRLLRSDPTRLGCQAFAPLRRPASGFPPVSPVLVLLLQIVAKLIDRHPVDARAAFVASHLPQCFLQVCSLTHLLHDSTRVGWAFGFIHHRERFDVFPQRLPGFTRRRR